MIFTPSLAASVALLFLPTMAVASSSNGNAARGEHVAAPHKHARAARAVSGVLSKKAEEAAAAAAAVVGVSDAPTAESSSEEELAKRGNTGGSGARMT